MAIRLINGAEFLHIPKTGGSWVEWVLKKNGLIEEYLGQKHATYDLNLFHDRLGTGRELLRTAAGMALKKLTDKLAGRAIRPDTPPVFRFCFVRHPLAWYESWWKYMTGKGWDDMGTRNSAADWHPNSVLNDLGSDDFNQFVWNVVREGPGYVSELYFSYTKAGISFVGKTESLRRDLARVLDYQTLKYDREHIDDSRPVNVSGTDSHELSWDPSLRQVVEKLELPALIHFGYLTDHELATVAMGEELGHNRALQQFAGEVDEL